MVEKYDLTTDQIAEITDTQQVSITRNGKKIRLTILDGRWKHRVRFGPPVIKKSGTLISLIQTNGLVVPDDLDRAIAQRRLKVWDRKSKPRVGDYVIMPDGSYERFSYDWGKGIGIQTCNSGSFHLNSIGSASMSGGLNPIVPYEKIERTNKKKEGTFWIFHHGSSGAHKGVGIKAWCRVYRVKK